MCTEREKRTGSTEREKRRDRIHLLLFYELYSLSRVVRQQGTRVEQSVGTLGLLHAREHPLERIRKRYAE